jgi:cAMP phosphodiesterase
MGDTGPTEEVWRAARKLQKLKAIFIKVSLPNDMIDIAKRKGHLTPLSLAGELEKLADTEPEIYLHHIEPIYRKIIRKEIAAIKDRNVSILEDGQRISI